MSLLFFFFLFYGTRVQEQTFFFPFLLSFSFSNVSFCEWASGGTRQENVHLCRVNEEDRGADTWSVNDLLGWHGNYLMPKFSRLFKMRREEEYV